jgi:hypothetical protein
MLMVSTRTHRERPVVLPVLLSHGYLVDSDSFYHALCPGMISFLALAIKLIGKARSQSHEE